MADPTDGGAGRAATCSRPGPPPYCSSIYRLDISDGTGRGIVLELAVLGLLKDQPLYGYELKKRLGETLGFLWGVSYGSLYPALRRLERAGAIASLPAAGPDPAPILPTGSITGDLAAARLRTMAG